VRDHGTPLVDDPARLDGVDALGLDETKFLSATPTHRTEYVTGFVDLRHARLLDIVPGRSARAVEDWLERRPEEWLAGIEVVALDPFRGYANGLISRLGHAEVVVDHFHAVALANKAIDDVRRRVQNEALGHRGRTGDPLYGIRRLLLIGDERFNERGRQRLAAGLDAGDRWGEVGAALLAKELLRETYAATDVGYARRRLVAFYQWCADAEVPELVRLAKTISAWQDEVLAYHTTGLSNGPTEAMNLLIEKGPAHRARVPQLRQLSAAPTAPLRRQMATQRTARIRGRQPRLVA
jgi:transposase